MQNNINIIDYIDKRLLEQKYAGTWITKDKQEVSIDLEQVSLWWNEYMKSELIKIIEATYGI